ncbi:hypothetical protein SMJ63A_210008 [Stenotrophomonas geniculata]
MEKSSRAWLDSIKAGSDQLSSEIRQIAANCRRRGGSGGRGVSGMDAATKPPWTGLRRPLPPDPPRHPTECRPLLLHWLLFLRVQGAAMPYSPNPRFDAPCNNALMY